MYLKHIHKYGRNCIGGSRQGGGLTIFTAVLVLILMTLLLVYATRVSLFETRVSGNELRQKQAFHVAEAALDQGVMYLLSNASLVLSSQVDKFPDGSGTTTRDGWFAAGSVRWAACPPNPATSHPCGGDVAATAGSFYYDTDGNTATVETLPVNTSDFPAGATARMTALMCFVDLDNPTSPCIAAPASEDEEISVRLVLTLLAYGYSDCTNVNNVSTCSGEATVALPISNYKLLEGSPAVPFVTKSAFPPSGTAEIVGNPNGGGVGVPLTTWINENSACPPTTPIISSGTWQTCEMEEWYHVPDYPPGVACTDNNCLCGPGGNDPEYFLSGVGFTAAQCSGFLLDGDTCVGIDIVIDPAFPCDLFEFYFGVPRDMYATIKNQALVLSDCSSLGPNSSGLIWISGSDCTINANTVIGSPDNPVILISATTLTKLNGGAQIFGILYLFDGEEPDAELSANGTNTIYGSCIVDASIDKVQGTFQVVYAAGVLADANGIGGLGSVNGGWRDFGLPDINWTSVASP